MAGVGILVEYSGSSDDEDGDDNCNSVAHVEAKDRPNKRPPTDIDDTSHKKHKTGMLPSVPAGIMKMFGETEDQSDQDDPSCHDGRVRSFKHERGNWATYVYIPVSHEDLLLDLATELSELLDGWNFRCVEHFHLSVSRTVVIRHHWIDGLMDALRDAYTSVTRFQCSFGSIKFYCNDEKTRTFLGIQVQNSQERLQEVVNKADDCLQQFRLPKYYEKPSFHVSLLWVLGDVVDKITDELHQQLQEHVDEFFSIHLNASYLDISELQCKTGNKLFHFPLNEYR